MLNICNDAWRHKVINLEALLPENKTAPAIIKFPSGIVFVFGWLSHFLVLQQLSHKLLICTYVATKCFVTEHGEPHFWQLWNNWSKQDSKTINFLSFDGLMSWHSCDGSSLISLSGDQSGSLWLSSTDRKLVFNSCSMQVCSVCVLTVTIFTGGGGGSSIFVCILAWRLFYNNKNDVLNYMSCIWQNLKNIYKMLVSLIVNFYLSTCMYINISINSSFFSVHIVFTVFCFGDGMWCPWYICIYPVSVFSYIHGTKDLYSNTKRYVLIFSFIMITTTQLYYCHIIYTYN